MEQKDNKFSGYFSKKLRAGKRRTYFFDVRSTKQGDFFLTITESKKRFDSDGYESHKIFLYKEDFKKFVEGLNETVSYIRTELMPDYDFDAERPAFNSREDRGNTADYGSDVESGDTGSSSRDGDEDLTWNA